MPETVNGVEKRKIILPLDLLPHYFVAVVGMDLFGPPGKLFDQPIVAEDFRDAGAAVYFSARHVVIVGHLAGSGDDAIVSFDPFLYFTLAFTKVCAGFLYI
ncbi:MAG: hypothetical protein ACD_47C00148G0001 [uncultured bacterium]|nr:MAG: hypothetical protein ACD_47C00148G0001 [uncultured bacterium]